MTEYIIVIIVHDGDYIMSDTSLLIVEKLEERGYKNIIIGMNNRTNCFDNCIMIGHNLSATEDNQILIADKNTCESDYPEAFQLIHKGFRMLFHDRND